MEYNVCKRCFKSLVDQTASDKLLLMSGDDMICPTCNKRGPVVGYYFKFGEHTVTPDGKHVVGEARHVGVNPNYSFFENSYPYADVDNYRKSTEDKHE